MSEFAILSRLQNDAHIRVINVSDDLTMDQVVEACLEPAVGYQTTHPAPGQLLRVRPTTPEDNAEPFPRDMTVKDAGFKHYECVDIYAE